jgi:ATP-dependent DNA helicase RecG
MIQNLPVELLRTIGPRRGEVLRKEAGISSVEDLIYFRPRRYLDRSKMARIADCFMNQTVTVAGKVMDISMSGHKRRFLAVTIGDGSGELSGVFFGGTQYYAKLFEPGDDVLFSGKIDVYNGRVQIVHPEYDFFDETPGESVHTGRIIPLYRSTEPMRKAGFTARVFRNLIHDAIGTYIDKIDDPLPPDIVSRMGYPSLATALRAIHFPVSEEELSSARERLAFNELFFLQYYLALSKKYQRIHDKRPPRTVDRSLYDTTLENLPFELTGDQNTVLAEIMTDLSNPYPMNRLLQGDVGSGKTAVAVLACTLAVASGKQCAVMAPTEVLARQHFSVFGKLLPAGVRIALLVGSLKPKEKKSVQESAASGDIDIVIGTHALIEDAVQFRSLGFAVVDEQHRFGVAQRAALHEKGKGPDILVMTATPIPRSLTLTIYGDLDSSVIKHKPANRLPVKTLTLPESREDGLFRSMEKYISEGRQCFYVLPLIHESEKSDLTSAIAVYERFRDSVFTHRRVALLHGRLKAAEKEEVMRAFAAGETDILVSTTVIEVGIDVPNATVMVIHHPERFGLSQLHQLRGRVGRGAHQAYCVLFHPDGISAESAERISVIEKNSDGFAIAEQDLKIRGAGDFIGSRQSGESSEFEFADLAGDFSLVTAAREEAFAAAEAVADIEAEISAIRNNYASPDIISGTRLSKILSLIS